MNENPAECHFLYIHYFKNILELVSWTGVPTSKAAGDWNFPVTLSEIKTFWDQGDG